jgi:hypothetical protein
VGPSDDQAQLAPAVLRAVLSLYVDLPAAGNWSRNAELLDRFTSRTDQEVPPFAAVCLCSGRFTRPHEDSNQLEVLFSHLPLFMSLVFDHSRLDPRFLHFYEPPPPSWWRKVLQQKNKIRLAIKAHPTTSDTRQVHLRPVASLCLSPPYQSKWQAACSAAFTPCKLHGT